MTLLKTKAHRPIVNQFSGTVFGISTRHMGYNKTPNKSKTSDWKRVGRGGEPKIVIKVKPVPFSMANSASTRRKWVLATMTMIFFVFTFAIMLCLVHPHMRHRSAKSDNKTARENRFA